MTKSDAVLMFSNLQRACVGLLCAGLILFTFGCSGSAGSNPRGAATDDNHSRGPDGPNAKDPVAVKLQQLEDERDRDEELWNGLVELSKETGAVEKCPLTPMFAVNCDDNAKDDICIWNRTEDLSNVTIWVDASKGTKGTLPGTRTVWEYTTHINNLKYLDSYTIAYDKMEQRDVPAGKNPVVKEGAESQFFSALLLRVRLCS